MGLLWLWHRPVAIGPIRPLAWDLPYTIGAPLKRKKKISKVEVFANAVNQEKEVKGIWILQEDIKLVSFANDMTIYEEYPKELTKTPRTKKKS